MQQAPLSGVVVDVELVVVDDDVELVVDDVELVVDDVELVVVGTELVVVEVVLVVVGGGVTLLTEGPEVVDTRQVSLSHSVPIPRNIPVQFSHKFSVIS